MKKIVQYGMILGLVTVLVLTPTMFTHQAHAGVFSLKTFGSGSITGLVGDDGSGIDGALNANARSPVVLVSMSTTSVCAKITCSIDAGSLAPHQVTCDVSADLSGETVCNSMTILENRINVGKLEPQKGITGLITTLDLDLNGALKVDGGEISTCDSTGHPKIIKIGPPILREIIEGLLDLLGYEVCFLEGTQILMADGTYKNIEDIVLGDQVTTYDIETEEISSSFVTEVFAHSPEEMPDYYIKINNEIMVTPNHFVYVNQTLLPAELVEVGQVITKIDSTEITVETVEKIYEQVPTYNFHIESETDFYIADDIPSFPLKITAVAATSPSGMAHIYLDSIAYTTDVYQTFHSTFDSTKDLFINNGNYYTVDFDTELYQN